MGQILLGLFAAYLLYNFIFRFLIPLIRVTRQVKRQVRDFQQHVNTQGQGGYHAGANDSGFQPGGARTGQFRADTFGVDSARQESKPKKDDYIDFEEIK